MSSSMSCPWPKGFIGFGFETLENCSQNGSENPPHAAHFFWPKIHSVLSDGVFFRAMEWFFNGFSMVFDHRTIAIESMALQSTIGDDGFSMVNEKKRQWFSKIAIYDKKLLLEFKLPTQIEIAQSYQEHHALLPHAMEK